MESKILIVEDDVISGKMLQKIIQNIGYKSIGIVSIVEDALLTVKKEKPDLVLMDIELSCTMDGIHTAEIINGYYHIPVIFVTGHADIKTVNRAKNIGEGYIIKPFFEQEIKKIIKTTLNKKRNGALAAKNNTEDTKLVVKNEDEIVFLEISQVYFFEAEGHKIYLHTKTNQYCVRGSLKKFEDMDINKQFLRCHKSYLVNMSKVEGLQCDGLYNYKIKIKGIKNSIPVSKDKVKMLKK